MKLHVNKIFLALAFLIPFTIYLITLAPDVGFTDSGELAAVCSSLGVAHPTGYPLFTLLGFLWTKLPLPFSTIVNLNIFVALLTSLSALVFFKLTQELLFIVTTKAQVSGQGNLNQLTISLVTSLGYSFSTTVWQQGTSLEVYALHLLMVNLVLLLTLKAFNAPTQHQSQKHYLIASFVLGLSFANHLTTILLLPALIFLYFKGSSRGFDFSLHSLKLFGLMLLMLSLGLSLYIYLPLISSTEPLFDWGGVIRGWDKFLYHVQGRQYQVWMFQDGAWKQNASKFLALLSPEFTWVGLPLILLGAYRLLRHNGTLFTFVVLLFFSTIFYSFNYTIHDIDTYFLLAFMSLFFFMLFGLKHITDVLSRKSSKLIYSIAIIPVLLLTTNFNRNDESSNYAVSEYTRILITNLEQDAIIISAQWDYFNSAFWYKQMVENLRPDVIVIEKELLRRTWYLGQVKRWYPLIDSTCGSAMDSFLEQLELFESAKPYDQRLIQARFLSMLDCFIDQNIGKRPIYLTMDVLQSERQVAAGYQKVPQGFALKLVPNLTGHSIPLSINIDGINVDKFALSLKQEDNHLISGIRSLTATNLINLGRYAFSSGNIEDARSAFKKVLLVDPTNTQARQLLAQFK